MFISWEPASRARRGPPEIGGARQLIGRRV